MLQLPPDSHWATPLQSCVAAAEAGAASTPIPTAAAPTATAPPRRGRRTRACCRYFSNMGDPPITACGVSCRVRANRCPAGRVVERTVRLHPKTRAYALASEVGPPPPSRSARLSGCRRTGLGGPAPRAHPVWPGHADDRKRDPRVSLLEAAYRAASAQDVLRQAGPSAPMSRRPI